LSKKKYEEKFMHFSSQEEYNKDTGGYFSKREIYHILSAARDNPLHFTWIKLLYSTGLTPGELVNIKVEDLDLRNNRIKIYTRKKLKNRTVPISNCLIQDLKIQAANKRTGEYLFQGRSGKLNTRTILKLMEKIEKKTGFSVSISKLRRSIALHLLEKGWEEKSVADILGYPSIRHALKFIGHSRLFYLNYSLPLDDIVFGSGKIT
jgi:integrase/recombinase XerD